MKTTRRKFIENAGIAMVGAGIGSIVPIELLSKPVKSISANDKINFGIIGAKGMGWANMKSHFNIPEVECIAICDIDRSVLDERSADVEKIRGNKPIHYTDYRRMLENKDIDVVIVATPDHWHCLNTIAALEAGKHVFVEKPLANSIEECNTMVKAARKYKKIVQVGQWQRSGSQYKEAIDYVRSGKLGNIRLVKTWAYQGWMKSIPKVPDGPVPNGVDYEMWLGPAPKRPFNQNRFHFTFRWFWDYAGGLMTDWGVHEIDIALYAMNAKAPISVMASGGKLAYPDDAAETPDTLQAIFEYDGFNMLWEHAVGIDGGNYGRAEGIAFIGNNGTLVVNRGGWEVIPETERQGEERIQKIEPVAFTKGIGNALDLHTKNFIDAIKANDPTMLHCGIETGSVAAINAHMGNVAFKTGRKVYWDDVKGSFKDDKEANSLIKPNYHNNWKFPQVG